MSAAVIPFPIVPRPLPPIADPRYRAGATALAAEVLVWRGFDRERAKELAEYEVERACRRALADAGYSPVSAYVEWHHEGDAS